MAGFIGSHLADALLDTGGLVSGADDLSLGRLENLVLARRRASFKFVEADLSTTAGAAQALGIASEWGGRPDIVWHLAANSDIPAGTADAQIDFRRTFCTTYCMVQAARQHGARRIAFASSSAIYGEHRGALTEATGPLLPISQYGAMKLASEAALSASAESGLDRLWIFRFPNVVGSRATHGVIVDLIARLHSRPLQLEVLGDGSQSKPYLHVHELVSAMQFIVERAAERRNVFNIGPTSNSTVAFIAEQVVARVAPGTSIVYGGGDRGWTGDVPRFTYVTDRLATLGWSPKLSSDEALIRAIDQIASDAEAAETSHGWQT